MQVSCIVNAHVDSSCNFSGRRLSVGSIELTLVEMAKRSCIKWSRLPPSIFAGVLDCPQTVSQMSTLNLISTRPCSQFGCVALRTVVALWLCDHGTIA